MKSTIAILLLFCTTFLVAWNKKGKWISLFNGQNTNGWTVRGKADWTVKEGILTGEGALGHIYASPVVKNFEVKGEFRITNLGKGANSGLYVRANEPADNPDGFPRGYEAQICNSQDAYTGWLWKPGKPTGKATELLTKDGEWFVMKVRAVGDSINIWVKEKLVMSYKDSEYTEGKFAIQVHNPGMRVEARKLFYREIK